MNRSSSLEIGDSDEGSMVDSSPSKTLRFTVRFRHPQDDKNDVAASSSVSSDLDDSVQTINITFEDDFIASPLSLSLHLRNDASVGYLYASVEPDPDPPIPGHDICIVNETIDLFPSESRQHIWTMQLFQPLHSTLWTILNTLLGTAIIVLTYILFNLPLHQTIRIAVHHSTLDPLSHHPTLSIRSAPLGTFDDLSDLLHHHIIAPLPLIANIQELVERHYQQNTLPPSHILKSCTTTTRDARQNITVDGFLGHFYWTSSRLCSAVRSWSMTKSESIRSHSPRHSDIALVCSHMERSVVRSYSRWIRASGTMSISWPVSARGSASTLLTILPKYKESVNPNDSCGDDDDKRSASDLRFYNETSCSILELVNRLFFDDDEIPGRLPLFAETVYDAAYEMEELELELANGVLYLSFLLNVVRNDILPDHLFNETSASCGIHKLRNDGAATPLAAAAAWVIGRSPEETSLALAKLVPLYREVLPLLATASSMTWIVGFTRRQVEGVVAELEKQGNATAALLAVPLPPAPLPQDNRSDEQL